MLDSFAELVYTFVHDVPLLDLATTKRPEYAAGFSDPIARVAFSVIEVGVSVPSSARTTAAGLTRRS